MTMMHHFQQTLPSRLLLLVAMSMLLVGLSRADGAKLVWQSVPNSTDQLALGEPFGDTVTFELGTFEVPFRPSLTNMAQWASRWTVIDRTTYNPDTGFFASTVQFANNDAPYTEGRQVYMWGTTGGSDPEWILATNSAWEFPDAALGFPLTWNIADASTVVIGSIKSSGSPYLMRMSQIQGVLSAPSLSPEQWLATKFTAEELDDEAVGQLHSDPDGDGRDNLMEMAVGSDPVMAETELEVPYAVDLVEVAGYRYLRLLVFKPNVLQLRYRVEVSSDLETWMSGPSSTATLVDSVSTLSVRDKVAFEAGQARFIRLTVEH